MRVGLFATAAVILCAAKSGLAQQSGTPDTAAPVIAAQGDTPAPPPLVFAPPDARLASPAPRVQTLRQALALTYRTSPALMAQRATLRGVDSGAALARAEGRPQVDTSAVFNQELYTTRKVGTLGRDFSASAQAEQVLFAGGRIRNSVQAADVRVIAARSDLRAVESDALTEAVGAYADVIRDRDIREFTQDQVTALEANLESTRSRLRVGDLTRTDVSQSEARLALAQSNLATAEGRLQSSEENFERVVGARAGMLEPLPPLPSMPRTADEAVEAALADNADVAALVARARAAGYDVAAAKAERMPTISAVGTSAYSSALGTADRAAGLPKGTLPNSATNIGAGFLLRLPLYQGGAASARVRQAEEARTVLMEQAIAAERLAVASARAAFATWRSSLVAITANETAVGSNEAALESVKVEQTVGSRSILDVLNAEQELLTSRIALSSARRDAYVAAFALLNTMGAAEAADLNPGLDPLYDPVPNYRANGRTWSDWADGPQGAAASTRTVPAQVDGPLTRLSTDSPTPSEKRP